MCIRDSYRGQHCPICGKEFCDGDDIVVCPECGTPYHRECYKTAGHGVNEERHSENFEWKPETAPHAEEKTPKAGQNANDDGHKAVSYTHLDVYKRQAMYIEF